MKAVLAGAFDPFTTGHRDIVIRAAQIFDGGVTVAVAVDTGKNSTALADRVKIAELSVADINNVRVVPFDGLLTDFLNGNSPCVLVRGIRGESDAMYERDLCRIYGDACDCECVYLFARAHLEHVSSTAVRALARLGGRIDGYVAPLAVDKVKEIYGVAAKKELK